MRNPIARLHYITQELDGHDLLHDIEAACRGGVAWVQLRLKNRSESELVAIAKEVKAICEKFSAVFIINDYVTVAAEVNADGVHLGKQDMPVNEARKLLGKQKVIGASTNSFEDIVKINELDVDYVGLGPLRFTTTKENLNPILGADKIRDIAAKLKSANIQLPVIAIGGIQLSDIEVLAGADIYGVAVSSAITGAVDIQKTAADFVRLIKHSNEGVLAN